MKGHFISSGDPAEGKTVTDREAGSTIGQPADLPRSRFGLRSRPSVAVESGKVIKRDQWVVA